MNQVNEATELNMPASENKTHDPNCQCDLCVLARVQEGRRKFYETKTASELERQSVESFPIKNAVYCGICRSPADRYENLFQCQANLNHVGDLTCGIFADLTPQPAESSALRAPAAETTMKARMRVPKTEAMKAKPEYCADCNPVSTYPSSVELCPTHAAAPALAEALKPLAGRSSGLLRKC